VGLGAVTVIDLLEELMESVTLESAAAMFDWLDSHVDALRGLPGGGASWRLPLLRCCNALARRLSRGRDAALAARLLLLLARVQSLAERSGVNNTVSD